MTTLKSFDPATGVLIREILLTPIETLPEIFACSRAAQKVWGALPIAQRSRHLLRLKELLIDRADEVIALISQENGKPRFEAMANEVIPSVELIGFFARKAPHVLADRRIPMSVMKHRTSHLTRWPLGVVAVISPWNYPFLLPMGEIIMSLVSGNSVIFKPSEITPLVGLKIQELCEAAGLPKNLIQTVIGDGTAGAAIIHQKPAKIFFTGSVKTGKKIMAAAAEHLIPVSLELGGKDAMIVLEDADLDLASSGALWGGFCNAGQACASVERVLVHESVADDFKQRLKIKLSRLRQGSSASGSNDLGPVTFEGQKDLYEGHLDEARLKGAEILTGGTFSPDRRYFAPTLVAGPCIEPLLVYREETFGPVVAITTFKSDTEAVEKANHSDYGLLASVFSRNAARAEQIARRLEVGTVTLNEVTYTAALPETPWGGVKDSGFGKKHSADGLLGFVNTRHIHKPLFAWLVFKSFWWFPYSPAQYASFREFLNLYRGSWLSKLATLPKFLAFATKLIRLEPRI